MLDALRYLLNRTDDLNGPAAVTVGVLAAVAIIFVVALVVALAYFGAHPAH